LHLPLRRHETHVGAEFLRPGMQPEHLPIGEPPGIARAFAHPRDSLFLYDSKFLVADPAYDRARLEGGPGDPDATGAGARAGKQVRGLRQLTPRGAARPPAPTEGLRNDPSGLR
ncbi:MAG: hypothetical protein ACREA0_08050, partial [bacterium]